MKKTLSILLLFVGFFAQAQYAPKVSTYGNWYNRLKTDSAQHIPRKFSLTLNDNDTTPQIFVKDTSVWFYAGGVYRQVGSGTGGGSSAWGSITGTLSAQTDLQSALNGKQNLITIGTTSQYFRGDLSLATFPTNVSTFTNDAGYLTGVQTQNSLTGNGTTGSKLSLVNDATSPGASMYYGTNSGGTKGFYSLPAGGSGTLTSVATSSPITGGTITTTGTIGIQNSKADGSTKGAAAFTSTNFTDNGSGLIDAKIDTVKYLSPLRLRSGGGATADTVDCPSCSTTGTLTNTHIFVGNASNVATDVALSGDATITNTGVLTVANNAISYGKFQQIPASSLFGNPTGSTANGQAISIGTGLSFAGSTLNASIVLGTIFNVVSYGAVHDGIQLRGDSILSGSSTLVNLAGPWVVGDIGKHILIDSAGPSHGRLYATITGFTNSTKITISTTASFSISNAYVFYSSDDTGPIQAAINAWAAGGHVGTIFSPAGIYGLWGPLVGNYNSQLQVPTVTANIAVTNKLGKSGSILFLGEAQPPWDQSSQAYTGPMNNGTIWYSCIDGTTKAIALGAGTIKDTVWASILATKADSANIAQFSYPFSYCDFYCSHMGFLSQGSPVTGGPTVGAINGRRFLNTVMDHIRVGIDESLNYTVQPTNQAAGIFGLETNGGELNTADHIVIDGFQYGFIYGEHFTANNLIFDNDFYPLCPAMNSAHAAHIERLLVSECTHGVSMVYKYPDLVVGTSIRSQIEQMDVEYNNGHWWSRVDDVYDTLNILQGFIDGYSNTDNIGAAALKNGGTNFTIKNIIWPWVYQQRSSEGYSAANTGVFMSDSLNGSLNWVLQNKQAGTASYAAGFYKNDLGNNLQLGITSSAYTTSGLFTANTGWIGSSIASSGSTNLLIFSKSNPIYFSTNAGTSAAWTIYNTTGDLVNTSTDGTGQIQAQNNGTGNRVLINVGNSTAGTATYSTIILTNDNGYGTTKGLQLNHFSSTYTGFTNWASMINYDAGGLLLGANGNYREEIDMNGMFNPFASITYDLGTSSLAWRDLYLSHPIGESAIGVSSSLGTNVSSLTPAGNDAYFKLTLVTSGGAVSGTLGVVAFGRIWGATPKCTISSADATTGGAIGSTSGGYVALNATSGTSMTLTGAITATGTYTFNCHCGQ